MFVTVIHRIHDPKGFQEAEAKPLLDWPNRPPAMRTPPGTKVLNAVQIA